MTTRGLASVLCAVCLVGVGVPSRAECTLNAGIQQAQEGEYASAITSLRCVVDRLVSSPQSKTDLKTAYIYLGVSYLGLDQEADAQRALISALKLDPALQLKTTDFPPRVVRFFEKVHKEAVDAHVVPPPPRVAQTATKKKSGGKGALLIIGGVAVAGGVGAVALSGGGSKAPVNRQPVPGFLNVEPKDAGLAAATEFTFTVTGASDPDMDPLTYRWDFKDGATLTTSEPQAKHTFGAASVAGPYAVTVTVSDGKIDVAGPSVSVTVKSMSGVWSGTDAENTVRNWTISQSGPQLTGTYYNSNCPSNTGSLEGTVRAPRSVHIRAIAPCLPPMTFDGSTDPQVVTMTGESNGQTLTFSRTQ